ncbi:unnamed protein product [Caenorhabditis brenneri]
MFRDFLNILVVLAVLGYSAPIQSDECLEIGARNCSMMFIFAKAALDAHVEFTHICPSLMQCTEQQIACSNLSQESVSEITSKCFSDLEHTPGTTTFPEYSIPTSTTSDEPGTTVATRLSWFGKWF